MDRKYLIVNADDFGLSEGVNRGIIEAGERGIVTSASLMVRQPAAESAARYARGHAGMSVGLHLDLGEWVFRDGEWVPLYAVVPPEDANQVAGEVARQLAEFRRLVGRDPTHIDSHQHVHRQEPARAIVLDLAREMSIPVRDCTEGIVYCGDFYGQTGEGERIEEALTCAGLERILDSLPKGITELGCHPGYGEGLATSYRDERVLELSVLCAPEIRNALDARGIRLCSFDGISRLVQALRTA
ncbi:MAG TPA: ChbG/HpnK family deacetylase [Verrucomicrobiae bacterium]